MSNFQELASNILVDIINALVGRMQFLNEKPEYAAPDGAGEPFDRFSTNTPARWASKQYPIPGHFSALLYLRFVP
jgi:hypothetical protein